MVDLLDAQKENLELAMCGWRLIRRHAPFPSPFNNGIFLLKNTSYGSCVDEMAFNLLQLNIPKNILPKFREVFRPLVFIFYSKRKKSSQISVTGTCVDEMN
uniref:(northern house mosquito) hypothetical protein n=1 Tax=Culex pipiens TaxID=7175 RepID=A0A8D8H3X7_CULPI